MTSPSSRWIEAISVLNEMTQTRRLNWEPLSESSPILSFSGDGLSSTASHHAFRTRYENKWLRIRKARQSLATLALGGGMYTLEILDDAGRPIFIVPEATGLDDLFRSIEYQYQVTSGANALLESLLKEKQTLK